MPAREEFSMFKSSSDSTAWRQLSHERSYIPRGPSAPLAVHVHNLELLRKEPP